MSGHRKGRQSTAASLAQPDRRVPPRTLAGHVIVASLLITVVVIQIVIIPAGAEPFRRPKQLAFRLEAMILILCWVWGAPLLQRPPTRCLRRVYILGAAATLWMTLVAITSTRPVLSADTMITFLSAVLVFAGAVFTMRATASVRLLIFGMIGGCANAVLAILQTLHFDPLHTSMVTGFVGNTNDLGCVLLPSVLAALALSFADSTSRIYSIPVLALLLAGLVVSRSMTAMVAFFLSVITLLLLIPGRKRLLAMALLLLLIAGALMTPPVRSRIANARQLLSTSETNDRRIWRLDEVLSYRLTAFVSAWDMFLDRPLLGLGPGTFPWHYFAYRLRVQGEHPVFLESISQNFGETHSDHLQTLAETGLPGYLLFIGAIVFVGSRSFRRRGAGLRVQFEHGDARVKTATALSLPLAVSFGTITIAQFPLHLAAATVTYLFYAAACIVWTDPEQ